MNKRNFDIFKYQLPALLWAIFILVLCVAPINGNSSGFFKDLPVDKMVHCFLFFVLTYLIVRTHAKHLNLKKVPNAMLIKIWVVCLVYGGLIEVIQHFFTTQRSADIWDVVADGVGCSVGILVFHWTNTKFSFHKR